jgi:hypothetical protein
MATEADIDRLRSCDGPLLSRYGSGWWSIFLYKTSPVKQKLQKPERGPNFTRQDNFFSLCPAQIPQK